MVDSRRKLPQAQGDLFSGGRPRTGPDRIVSVSELTGELKGLIEGRFARVSVRGEISNFRGAAGSGHLYFTLKDDGACLSAVLFAREASRLRFGLKDGLAVIARGRVSLYEPRGQYQLICEALEPEGAGALALAFEQLKQKLAREGLFDPARKRKLPYLPRRIGLVTSASGAAIIDFLRVLHERFPIPVLVAPARVQGEGAAAEIAEGVRRLGASGLVDVVVVTRGGGSIEDLWAFNEEKVARAIAACPVPVVSAVGHEVDFTISDFVADRRCATPTDAAKTLAPVREELLRALDKHRRHLRELALRQVSSRRERLQHRAARLPDPRRAIAHQRLALDERADRCRDALLSSTTARRARLRALEERLAREHPRARLLRLTRSLTGLEQGLREAMAQELGEGRERLYELQRRLFSRQPSGAIAQQRHRLASLRERADKATARRVGEERVRLSRAAAALQSLSPLAVLARGYSIAFVEGGNVLKSAGEAPVGTRISLLLPDRSELEAEVKEGRPRRE